MNRTDKGTERAFMVQVIQLAQLLGWKVYHTHDSRRSSPGFPDLVLAKPDRQVIYAELKNATGKTTAEQEEWLDLLRQTPHTRVYLWRPADLNEITNILGE